MQRYFSPPPPVGAPGAWYAGEGRRGETGCVVLARGTTEPSVLRRWPVLALALSGDGVHGPPKHTVLALNTCLVGGSFEWVSTQNSPSNVDGDCS